MNRHIKKSLAIAALVATGATSANPVIWTDWTSGTTGTNGTATGVMQAGASTINVSYSGQIIGLQTNGGTNYWIGGQTGATSPFVSALVDNAPGTPDIIRMSTSGSRTLTFSTPVENLFFAVVSLNGTNNGYDFNQDFSVTSYGKGHWGNGTLVDQGLVGSSYRLTATSEGHGVIQFAGPVTSLTWNTRTSENWNGFTVGTYAVAAVPEPGTWALFGAGLLGLLLTRRRR